MSSSLHCASHLCCEYEYDIHNRHTLQSDAGELQKNAGETASHALSLQLRLHLGSWECLEHVKQFIDGRLHEADDSLEGWLVWR